MRTKMNPTPRQTPPPYHRTIECPDPQELSLRPHMAILAALHNVLGSSGQAIQAAAPGLRPDLDRCPGTLVRSTQHTALAILHLAAILQSAIEQHFEAVEREYGQFDLVSEDIPF